MGFLLQEDIAYLLQENGAKIILDGGMYATDNISPIWYEIAMAHPSLNYIDVVSPVWDKMESVESSIANDNSTFNETSHSFNEAGKQFNGLIYRRDGFNPTWKI